MQPLDIQVIRANTALIRQRRDEDPSVATALAKIAASKAQAHSPVVQELVKKLGLEGAGAAYDVVVAAQLALVEAAEARARAGGGVAYGERGSFKATDGGVGKSGGPLALRMGELIAAKGGAKTEGKQQRRDMKVAGEAFPDPRCEQDQLRMYSADRKGGFVEQVSVPQAMGKLTKQAKVHALPTEKPVTGADVVSLLASARAQRTAWLANLEKAPSNARVLPEDQTLLPKVAHMVSDGFPNDDEYIRGVARVGALEGFVVVAARDASFTLGDDIKDVLSLVNRAGNRDCWSEDSGEISEDGTVSVPVRYDEGQPLDGVQMQGRVLRLHPELTQAEREALPSMGYWDIVARWPDVNIPVQGGVAERDNQQAKAAIAVGRGVALRENLSYVEGGNAITGSLPSGEGYVLIGKDSMCITQRRLEADLGRAVKPEEVQLAIAKDYGIETKNVFFCEQAGDFHLDMSMAAFAPGHIVVNDALAAARLSAQWARDDHANNKPVSRSAGPEGHDKVYLAALAQWEEDGRTLEDGIQALMHRAAHLAEWEAKSCADIEAAGLKVTRMPGRFFEPGLEEVEVMNFLNGESATSARGGTFFMTNGGDARAEQLVAKTLCLMPGGPDRIYFADRSATKESLVCQGALNCRVKWEGSIAAPQRENA